MNVAQLDQQTLGELIERFPLSGSAGRVVGQRQHLGGGAKLAVRHQELRRGEQPREVLVFSSTKAMHNSHGLRPSIYVTRLLAGGRRRPPRPSRALVA